MNHKDDAYAVLFDVIGALARRKFQVGERAFATLGLNHTEARLLTLLDQHQGETTQELLSAKLNVDRSNAGRGIASLEAMGFLSRSKDQTNGRTRLVKITNKGASLVKEIERMRILMAESFFGELSRQDAILIASLLKPALSHPTPSEDRETTSRESSK